MKIAIMARTFDDRDGVGIANRNIIDRMIDIDRETEYVVLHRNSKHLGRYKQYDNVKEILLRAPSKLIWDQILVPYYARKENVDLIYHPKFTVPLLTGRPTVVVCQGLEYYTLPQYYVWYDLMYAKMALPFYYRKATKVVAISDDLQNLLNRYLKVPYERMDTVYLAANEIFSQKTDRVELEDFAKRHQMPDNYILTVTKVYQDGKLSDRKNVDSIVKAYLNIRKSHPSLKLVLAGEECHRFMSEVFGDEIADDPGFVYPGWIPQEEMPYLYSLAKLLAFPSFSESFGIPLAEAMACGCPVVTSTGGSCPEVVGDAAIVVEPTDVQGLSTAMDRILTDADLSRQLSEKGLERAKEFSWTLSAEKTVRICKEVYAATKAQR